MEEAVAKNDFVLLKFEGKAAGQVFEKTPPGSPILVVAGAKQVLPALDSLIIGSKVGEEKAVSLPFMQAFGPRREELVRLVPLSQFRSSGVDPQPGQVVELDGVPARVQSVAAGRVRVDFNHELAGKDVDYAFTVIRKYSDTKGKAVAAAESILRVKEDSVALEGDTVKVEAGPSVTKDANYFIAKTKFVATILEHVPQVSKVQVLETYVKPAPAKPE